MHVITAFEVLVFGIGVFVHKLEDGSCNGDTKSVFLANACGRHSSVIRDAPCTCEKTLGCTGVWLCMLERKVWDLQQSGL